MNAEKVQYVNDVDLAKKLAAFGAAWWAERLMLEDKRDKFEEILRSNLESELVRNIEWVRSRTYDRTTVLRTYVDYDPDDLLLAALRGSGIDCRGCMFSASGLFPFTKTGLVFHTYGIEQKCGYGAGNELILKAVKEEAE